MAGDMERQEVIGFAASVVVAYVDSNKLIGSDLPGLIGSVHGAFARLFHDEGEKQPPAQIQPAVPIRKSHSRIVVL